MTGNWVANGLSQDLPAHGVMPGQWQGTDLAIWRAGSGRVSAWKDRCPHRGMRLSHGFVRGETLACIYHGWVYGTDGTCRHIPAHPAMQPPASIRAESFQVREQDGLIWVGPATAANAPPAVEGMVAVRSITVLATHEEVAAAAPELTATAPECLRGAVVAGPAAVDLCLVLQPKAGATVVHALAGAGADLVAASRWLETLRRTVESGVAA